MPAIALGARPAGSTTKHSVAGIVLCHFTAAHAQLKSRSFHRTCLPLSSAGFEIRYVSPAAATSRSDGVEFVPIALRSGRFRSLLRAPRLVWQLLAQDADLYHFQDPELLPLAFVLKLLFRKCVVYDAYEDFRSAALTKRSIPPPLRPVAARAVAVAESAAAHFFDGIITADPFTLRRLAHAGRCSKLVLYNFPNLDFFPPVSCPAPSFDLVYRGGITERTGIFVLLEAMNVLAAMGKSLRLLLIGYFDSSCDEHRIRDRVRALGLSPNVEIRGRIPHEQMSAALAEARIGLCPLQLVPKFARNIPVKIFEYWACGLPVVATDLPPIRPFFRDGHAGVIVPPGDSAALARAIAWLLDHPREGAHMGANGRALIAAHWNNAAEIPKLARFFRRIARCSRFARYAPRNVPAPDAQHA